MRYYQKDNNYAIDLNGKTYKSESVWVFATRILDRWILMSHGPEKEVKEKYKCYINSFVLAGYEDEIKDTYIFDISDFGIEEINKSLDITNYIGNLIKADMFGKKIKKEYYE